MIRWAATLDVLAILLSLPIGVMVAASVEVARVPPHYLATAVGMTHSRRWALVGQVMVFTGAAVLPSLVFIAVGWPRAALLLTLLPLALAVAAVQADDRSAGLP